MFANIILPFPLEGTFTYLVPFHLESSISPGVRVIVPFGNKKLYSGIVLGISDNDSGINNIKEIRDVIDSQPIVNNFQLQLWQWLAQYYFCTLGEVMRAALPTALKLESNTRIELANLTMNYDADPDEIHLINILKQKNECQLGELIKMLPQKPVFTIVKKLEDKGLLLLYEKIEEKYKPHFISYVKLNEEFLQPGKLDIMMMSIKKAKKQIGLVDTYLQFIQSHDQIELPEVLRDELLEKAQVHISVLNALVGKGVFEIFHKKTDRFSHKLQGEKQLSTLNPIQKLAFEQVNQEFNKHKIVLLYGITGSGKTEVYIHLAHENIQMGKQVLYLVPEIALTPQLVVRLEKAFGKKVGVYHSKFSDTERAEIWKSIPEKFSIVIGVRSAVFLPFTNLGLIIVDEEHENTLKQFDPAPRYHARDTAIVLASMHNAKVLLGSATPSLESIYNVKNLKYGFVSLNARFNDAKLPDYYLVNSLLARKNGHMHSILSDELINRIKTATNNGKQTILFHNRRGYAPFSYCEDCGWIPTCRHCDVSLTLHRSKMELTCHYCGYQIGALRQCTACGSTNIKTNGFGTEKVEEEISLMLPDCRVERMDTDSMRRKNALSDLISRFESGSIDVLIGTQMVAKGLDFHNVTLVGILDADSLLNYPDFRAHERAFQLMTQVSGRAGRGSSNGTVVIQVNRPGHQVIRHLIKNDYMSLVQEMLEERKEFRYPPFYRILKLTLKHKDENKLVAGAMWLSLFLKNKLGERVVGPDSPLIGRIQGVYIRNIYIKMEKEKALQPLRDLVNYTLNSFKKDERFKSIFVSFDMDPV